jgi:hypothetical protein
VLPVASDAVGQLIRCAVLQRGAQRCQHPL